MIAPLIHPAAFVEAQVPAASGPEHEDIDPHGQLDTIVGIRAGVGSGDENI